MLLLTKPLSQFGKKKRKKKSDVYVHVNRVHVRIQTYGHKDSHTVIHKAVIFILADCRVWKSLLYWEQLSGH